MGLGIKTKIKKFPIINYFIFAKQLSECCKKENSDMTYWSYLRSNYRKITIIKTNKDKIVQINKLIRKAEVKPVKDDYFFYSIDENIKFCSKFQILDNYSIDYSWVVNSFIGSNLFDKADAAGYSTIVSALRDYIKRVRGIYTTKYISNFDEIESLFIRPANHFHEAIQRILFVNQWLWQSGHKHNGFGHLDWILNDLYVSDIDNGVITKEEAKLYLTKFFLILHDKCWYKSSVLLGDTGQIVILGGNQKDGKYHCNELTYLFIEISKELKLPDPKVLLRVGSKMPDALLKLALECISTGIGAPFLSNDDAVIPSLVQFGYEIDDAYNYATSACWEPLVVGDSCDQNNVQTVNFCEPFDRFINSKEFEQCADIQDIKDKYYKYLEIYLNELFESLDSKVFEEDPLLTLFSPDVLESGKDIVRGGAKYANLGLTSVGMSTVVNSILNLKHYVFETGRFSLQELNSIRTDNFEEFNDVQAILHHGEKCFGNDDIEVVDLTNEIMLHVSSCMANHRTHLGGKYKYGLSSPNYIVSAKSIGATFDGRKRGQPFGVHISCKNALPPTELISFASQLNYGNNRFNGNVVDLIFNPLLLEKNFDKIFELIKGGIKQGFFQMQINVVDSKTLVMAQKNPELYSDLIVRVWGFSAYFNDLPKEYQDYLINRVIASEKVA